MCDVLDWGVMAWLNDLFSLLKSVSIIHFYIDSLGSVVLGRALF